jgi:hypothetical protein
MPYDPNWPQNGQNVDADRFRDQFGSLKTLIDAIQGGITNVVVDAVNTVPPGTPASVGVSLSGTELHFTFGIPQGNEGPQGHPGSDGIQGPPFANAVVDAVNTLPPGSNAAVNVSFDGTNVHFTFDIPQGNEGPTGATGEPGEVTLTDLDNGLQNNLSQCSNNSNGVNTLDTPMADPDVETLRQKMDELINALRR